MALNFCLLRYNDYICIMKHYTGLVYTEKIEKIIKILAQHDCLVEFYRQDEVKDMVECYITAKKKKLAYLGFLIGSVNK